MKWAHYLDNIPILCTAWTKMKRLIQWHKNILNEMVNYFGMSLYQALWLAFVKGAIIGYIPGEYT